MRIQKQILQEEMANLVGMKQATYSRKERGISKITMEEWEIMSKILQVEITAIYQDFSRKNQMVSNLKSPHLDIPNYILEEIDFLKRENLELKEEIILLKEKLKGIIKLI